MPLLERRSNATKEKGMCLVLILVVQDGTGGFVLVHKSRCSEILSLDSPTVMQ